VLTLRDHNIEDYATLRDMDTTDVAVLDAADRACLDQLGQYLVSSDTWERFAIWLLHKHFEPAPGEVFVERVSAAPRGTDTVLVERSAADLAMTSLRFDPGVAGVALIGMEFADPVDFGPTAPLSDDDEAVLAGVAKRLRGEAKTERFGVRLIRNPLGLLENEVLVETCDLTRRTLHCSVDARDRVRAGTTIETSWQWKPSRSKIGPRVKQYCMGECAQDSGGNHYTQGHTMYGD
jgi:hypothetical protein